MKNLSVEEARARMLARAPRLEAEAVALSAAAMGRVLAETVTATRDQPPFDASAMDGWAVRFEDARTEARLKVAGESAAGAGYDARMQAGEAVRIFTGAPVPAGADTVVIQEEARREGDVVTLGPVPEAGRHIRPRGGDFKAGEVLLAPGQRLDPWGLSLAASAGRPTLQLARRPKVAILGGGDELATPGSEPGPWQIFESTTPALARLVEAWGGEALPRPRVADDLNAIVEAVRNCGADIVVTIGGASVGDRDLVRPALAQLGLELDVSSIAMRPGKPTFFGRLGDGRLALGLAGNPASALVGAELFLRSILLAMQGADPQPRLETARTSRPLSASVARERWMRARLTLGDDGVLTVDPFLEEDSSLVSIFARADALLRVPADAAACEAGSLVQVLRLGRVW
ncbi:MAG: gephyrin-like molybdotransferase Glp [Caulobacteraceae bacterium]